jgi:ribonuclease-3
MLLEDGGLIPTYITQVADKVFAETLFKNDPDLLDVWVNYPPHPLQEQEPLGDRKWIPSFELLQVSVCVSLG